MTPKLPDSSRAIENTDGDNWDAPRPIGKELPKVDILDPNLLPACVLPYLTNVARDLQVALDSLAAVLMGVLAGVLGRRAFIRPKPNSEWQVWGPLWGMLIMPSGAMKSPCLSRVSRFVDELQNEAFEQYGRLTNLYEAEVASGRTPPRPKCKRYVVNEATFAAIHQVHSDNPAGVLILRDEIMGFLETLSASGREGDRQFFLEASSGNQGMTVDRIGRGTIRLPRAAVSIFGTTQPARVEQFVKSSVRKGDVADGFLPRFQLTVWPDTNPDWEYVDERPDQESVDAVSGLFRRIVDMPADQPREYRFDTDAQVYYIDFSSVLESRIRRQIVEDVIRAHLSKYRSLMPCLAMILQVAEAPDVAEIPLERAVRAASWCGYLESHARRLYSSVMKEPDDPVRTLAERIRAGALSTHFSLRELYKNDWAGLSTPEEARQALNLLAEAGWVRRVEKSTRPQGGRPSELYVINPRIYPG